MNKSLLKQVIDQCHQLNCLWKNGGPEIVLPKVWLMSSHMPAAYRSVIFSPAELQPHRARLAPRPLTPKTTGNASGLGSFRAPSQCQASQLGVLIAIETEPRKNSGHRQRQRRLHDRSPNHPHPLFNPVKIDYAGDNGGRNGVTFTYPGPCWSRPEQNHKDSAASCHSSAHCMCCRS